MLSKETGYVVRLLVYLRDQNEPVPVREVAKRLNIPPSFLAKLVQRAARRGWVITRKGPGGGMLLGVDPSQLRLLEIVETLEGRVLERCVLGLPECGGKNPCPLHSRWEPVRDTIYRLFSRTTLNDLAFETLTWERKSNFKEQGGSR